MQSEIEKLRKQVAKQAQMIDNLENRYDELDQRMEALEGVRRGQPYRRKQ